MQNLLRAVVILALTLFSQPTSLFAADRHQDHRYFGHRSGIGHALTSAGITQVRFTGR